MSFNVNDLLGFDKLITPVIIKIVYYLAMVLVVLAGLFSVVQGQFIPGILMVLFGPLLVRFYCELLIVVFNMHNYLRDIRDQRR